VNRVYLDDAAGARVLPEVIAALKDLPAANPSSLHAEGRAARAALDRARDMIAQQLQARRGEITFTSSGTEAVNLAIFGLAHRLPKSARIVTWAAEHQSILATARWLEAKGYPVTILPVDGDARASAESIPDDAAIVSIGLANNEVGTIQPIEEIAPRARELGAWVHIDACQGPQWIDPCVQLADLASFSGHKVGAGRGGVLVVAPSVRLDPLLHGGPQEWGRRAGREDVAAAVAVASALDVLTRSRREQSGRVRPLAARLQTELQRLGGRSTGGEPRLANYACAAFSSRKGEDLLLALDFHGLAASSGSACASGSLDPSHVLLAMGLSLEESLGSLRLTLSYATTEMDVRVAIEALRSALTLQTASIG